MLFRSTERIRIGMAFNIVPQWHPLKLAEDFATLHNISGGRGILGVGRGTVPREAQSLGTAIGSFDNPDQAAADEVNRAQFDEAMQVIRLALDNESFSFHGDVYDFPPPGIPDRGGFVDQPGPVLDAGDQLVAEGSSIVDGVETPDQDISEVTELVVLQDGVGYLLGRAHQG